MAKVLFFTATAAQYAALGTKNENAIYFLTDTGEIFKGSTPFSFPCQLVESFPASGEKGVIYINAAGTAKFWTGTAYIEFATGTGADGFLNAVARHVVTAGEAGSGVFADASEGDVGVLFTMSDDSQMFISLTDLVDTYAADNAGSNAITVSVSGYNVSADLNVSADADNQLEVKNDGVYVGPLAWETL
jgi:hypothetical protein